MRVSTLKALFEGKRALFEGLWIENHHDFQPKPIIHLDFSALDLKTRPLEQALFKRFAELAHQHQIPIGPDSAKNTLKTLITHLGQADGVVVLVDEYDKPITDYLDNPAKRQENQDTLKSIYGLLKPMDPYLHRVLITGVSKFGKLSLFSDLNNLYDASLDPKFAVLLGYTSEEIQANFKEYLETATERTNLSLAELWESLQFWYNGYSWDAKQRVYCPFSMLSFLNNPVFKGYWYETGTPTFLLKLIKEQGIEPFYLESLEASDQLISVANIEHLDPISLMFQTGYLTIHSAEFSRFGPSYQLGYPNEEVRQAFSGQLLQEYLGDTGYKVGLNGA